MQCIGMVTTSSIKDVRVQDYSLDPSDYLSDPLLDLTDKTVASIPELANAIKPRKRGGLDSRREGGKHIR